MPSLRDKLVEFAVVRWQLREQAAIGKPAGRPVEVARPERERRSGR